jgi:ribosome-binding protein aMBF1 (putative translation factor)
MPAQSQQQQQQQQQQQDFRPVVFRKEQAPSAHVPAAGRRTATQIGADKLRELADGSSSEKRAEIPKAFSTMLQKARLAKGLSQANLARAINQHANVVKSYENGTAVPNGIIIRNLNRALGMTLPSAKASRVADHSSK